MQGEQALRSKREDGLVMRARRDGDVLVVVAGGLVTVKTLRELRAFIGGRLAELDARAVVVDLRQAVHALDADGWEQVARDAADSGLGPPVAMVVRDQSYMLVVHHCYRVAEYGPLRKAFKSAGMERALSWASKRREYWSLASQAR